MHKKLKHSHCVFTYKYDTSTCTNTHVHGHTNTHTHTCTQTHAHTNIHTKTQSHTYEHMSKIFVHCTKGDVHYSAWSHHGWFCSHPWPPVSHYLFLGGAMQLPSGYFSRNILTMSGSLRQTPSSWLPRVILENSYFFLIAVSTLL